MLFPLESTRIKLLSDTREIEIQDDSSSQISRSLKKKKEVILIREEDKKLSHREKLDILRHNAPKFSNNLKFWPLFDTSVLSQYSFAFYYYYELYYFLVKLLLLMTVLAIGYFAISYFLQSNEKHEVGLWVFFAYSVVTMIIIRICTMSQEKRVMKKRDNQAEDWTENKFALLVENIPTIATREEIQRFFEQKIQENGYEDKIRKVMLLQDCSIYIKLEKELRKLTYEHKRNFVYSQNVVDNIIKIETQIDSLLRGVDNFQLYRGKAIIIFETLRGKITVEKCLKNSKLKRTLYRILPKTFGKRYRFNEHLLKIKEAPEPSDIFFEKIHIPDYKIYLRKLLAYFLSSLAVIIGIGIIVVVKVEQSEVANSEYKYPLLIYSSIIIGTTMAIYIFADLFLEKVLINKTKTSCEIGKLKIRLMITYLNINVYLVILMQNVPEFEVYDYQMLLTALILIIIIPLRKILSVLGIKKFFLRRKLYQDPNCFDRYTQQEIMEIFTNPEYDFANNIEDSVCFIFFAVGFYFIGHLYIVVIIFIGLLISICVDKWVMINFTSPTKIKGSELGLEFFRVLKWDLRLQLLTLLFIPSIAFAPATIPTALRSVCLGFYCLFWFWDFRGNLRKRWKKKWCKQREMTRYEDVKRFFPHAYGSEYPYEVY